VYYLNGLYFSTYCHATSTKIVNSQLCEENLGNTVRELCSRKVPCMCYQQKISLPSLCTPQQTHKWQAVCNRYWCEASCHLLTTDAWTQNYSVPGCKPWYKCCIINGAYRPCTLYIPSPGTHRAFTVQHSNSILNSLCQCLDDGIW